MQIQVNADNHLESNEARDEWARGIVDAAMGHFADHVTRVEVHLSDGNGKGGAPDKRCMIEAHVNGRPPVVAGNDAASLDAAVNGAARKLVRATGHAIGRADKHAREARRLPAADAGDDDLAPSRAPAKP